MAKRIKQYFSIEKNVARFIFSLFIIIGVGAVFAPQVLSYFHRSDTGSNYIAGYGYATGGYGYGYGYGYGSDQNKTGTTDLIGSAVLTSHSIAWTVQTGSNIYCRLEDTSGDFTAQYGSTVNSSAYREYASYSAGSNTFSTLANGTQYTLRCFSDDGSMSYDSQTTSAIATPSGLTTTVVSTSAIDLSWTAVSETGTTYKVYRDSVLITSPTTNSYSDTGLSAGTSYSYTVSAVNTVGNAGDQCSAVASVTNSASSGGGGYYPTSDTTTDTTADDTATKDTSAEPTAAEIWGAEQLAQISNEAENVNTGDINAVLNNVNAERNLTEEVNTVNKYIKPLFTGITGLNPTHQNAMTNFIAYGTQSTLILGAGERAGVLNSYKAAYGKLPTSQADWNDVIKIANGRFTAEQSIEAEQIALTSFVKVYKRLPVFSNPNDNAATKIMAYGLRPTDRNLNSEKAAIKTFKAIYGYNPESATAWDIVRAIAYSGATR